MSKLIHAFRILFLLGEKGRAESGIKERFPLTWEDARKDCHCLFGSDAYLSINNKVCFNLSKFIKIIFVVSRC